MQRSNLNRLEYFVAIAEAGTITAAADRMRVSKAVVSKQLQLLEEELETTLVVRNSRHLNLTEIGHKFYEAARASVAQADEAFDMARHGSTLPLGKLRITAPLDLGSDYVAPAIASFREIYPTVKIDLTLSDTQFDPVESRFDIAYRAGWLTDSANVARKLADFKQILVASPAFIAQHGHPKTPFDLEGLPFIEHRALKQPNIWTLKHHLGETAEVEFTPSISVDVTPAIKALAMAGSGFAILPDFYIRDECSLGKLVQVFPDWSLPSGGIYSVFPPIQFRSAATREFADLFAAHLKKRLG